MLQHKTAAIATRSGVTASSSSSKPRLKIPTKSFEVSNRGTAPLPPVVNWHLEKRCNYGCDFCFATFEDIPSDEVPGLLKAGGATKITFVGGEPFLHPHIEELIMTAKAAGLITTAVTNGSRVDAARLLRLQGKLDWLAFSIDASDDSIHASMGRGMAHELSQDANRLHDHKQLRSSHTSNVRSKSHQPGGSTIPSMLPSTNSAGATAQLPIAEQAVQSASTCSTASDASTATSAMLPAVMSTNRHLARILELWPLAQELGYKLKLNTVVCRANLHDDMVPLVRQFKPDRWKVFQVLPVEGQNSGSVERLLISREEFAEYVNRHKAGVADMVPLIAEDNDAMLGSYAMLDARCRFYTNATVDGRHEYGPDLWEAGGVAEAWQQVAGQHFDAAKFLGRDGLYNYGQDETASATETVWAEKAASMAATRNA